MNSPVGPKVRPGTVLRVAKDTLGLPQVGTLGTVIFVRDLSFGVQFGPDDRRMVSYGQLFRQAVTIFQP